MFDDFDLQVQCEEIDYKEYLDLVPEEEDEVITKSEYREYYGKK